MSNQVITPDDITLNQVFSLAERLRPMDQVRLIARLAPKVEWALEQVEPAISVQARKPLRGLLSDLGTAPSAEEIDEMLREMWVSFAQEKE